MYKIHATVNVQQPIFVYLKEFFPIFPHISNLIEYINETLGLRISTFAKDGHPIGRILDNVNSCAKIAKYKLPCIYSLETLQAYLGLPDGGNIIDYK